MLVIAVIASACVAHADNLAVPHRDISAEGRCSGSVKNRAVLYQQINVHDRANVGIVILSSCLNLIQNYRGPSRHEDSFGQDRQDLF